MASSSIDNHQPPLVAIVGPTAVGKTGLALHLGQRLGVEVISADSRQVYRWMDIGTAKPTPEERAQVPHHLIDVIDPDVSFTLAQYQRLAYRAIDDVLARGKQPLLVGGTGQYVRAVLEGWSIPAVPPDSVLREQLFAEAEDAGSLALHGRLRQVDPAAAERIDHRNVRRVVRALEVYIKTGQPISELQRSHPPPYRILRIGLTMPRAQLYERVDARVGAMMDAGLVSEVQHLLSRGFDCDLPSMSGLGYRELCMFHRDRVALDEAIRLIKSNTRRFIRHQYNWFHPNDSLINWFDLSLSSLDEIEESVASFCGLP